MKNCEGCGVVLDPSSDQINSAVDEILHSSLKDAEKKGGVCPLCGHSKEVPYSNRKTVLFGLLVACLLAVAMVGLRFQQSRYTRRYAAAAEAVRFIASNPAVTKVLGSPITLQRGVEGEIKEDETGWTEAHLTIPIRGPKAAATAHVIGGRTSAVPWKFTTIEIEAPLEHKKIDVISGRIVEYDPDAYVDVHTQAAGAPQFPANLPLPAPALDGTFPCVYANVSATIHPAIGRCTMPLARDASVDRFEVDLRFGRFVLRQSDLLLNDVFRVPLTRSYTSWEPIPISKSIHAFGKLSNHSFDIAPVGTRNPYTYLRVLLEDGDFLHFDRISLGSSYADAVYRHSETSTPFYKSTIRWNGNGWTLRMADGSMIIFPESYNGKNLAQGAPTEFRDPDGNQLLLRRDPQRNLLEIHTPHDHWIKFTYDGAERIIREDDDAGNWTKYVYNPDGMLADVYYSSRRERHYAYDHQLMTQIRDEKEQVLLTNSYYDGSISRQQFADGSIYTYQYDWPTDSYFPTSVSITGPGNVLAKISVADSVPNTLKHYRK